MDKRRLYIGQRECCFILLHGNSFSMGAMKDGQLINSWLQRSAEPLLFNTGETAFIGFDEFITPIGQTAAKDVSMDREGQQMLKE